MSQKIQSFYDPDTFSWTHVLWCVSTSHAVIIDPVLNYDPHSGRSSTGAAEEVISFIRQHDLSVDLIVETHAHADHLTAAQYLKQQLGAGIAIGEGICRVQQTFRDVFNLGDDFSADGGQFDRLLVEGESVKIGKLRLEVIATPGHTNDSISLRSIDAVFIGDTMFSPGYGTARCDFPGGDAVSLYRSIRKLLALPMETRLYLCHDYPDPGASPIAVVSVAEQRHSNVHINDDVSEQEFVKMRTARDLTLAVPRLLLPAVQFNIRAGQPPAPESNGVSYLKIPFNQLQ